MNQGTHMNVTGLKQRLILFDLDGTLVDTSTDICWALNALLLELGLNVVSERDVRGWIGNGTPALVEHCLEATGGNKRIRTVDALCRYLDLYEAHIDVGSRLYPGTLRTLGHLRVDGYRLGICTNKPTYLAMKLLTALGIGKFFEVVIGGDAVRLPKPHPQHILETIRSLSPESAGTDHVLMVGDAVNDVLAARAAEVPIALMRYGYSTKPVESLNADWVLSSMAELPGLAARYFSRMR